MCANERTARVSLYALPHRRQFVCWRRVGECSFVCKAVHSVHVPGLVSMLFLLLWLLLFVLLLLPSLLLLLLYTSHQDRNNRTLLTLPLFTCCETRAFLWKRLKTSRIWANGRTRFSFEMIEKQAETLEVTHGVRSGLVVVR